MAIPRQRFVTAALALCCALAAAPSLAASRLACRDLPDLLDGYLRKHVQTRSLEPTVRARAVDAFLRRVDPQRTLLLESEASEARAALEGAFDAIRGGNCATLRAIHTQLLERHAAIERIVRADLRRPDFALEPGARVVLDPDERARPRDEAERAKRVRALVQFQISNYLESDHDLEDAKKRVVHRYELATRRWAERSRADLFAVFLDAFANGLDPHSGYLSADDLEDFQIGMQLSLEGIGVALSERDGYSVVEQIIPGGAADQLGQLRPKDKIIAVANAEGEPVDVIDMALRDVVRLIRGKKGSTVELTVLRQTEGTERFQVAIVRDKINLDEQAAKLRIEKLPMGDRELKLAVLDLPSFYGDRDPTKRQASRDVARILRQVGEEGADGLLLDLSRNGGGLLEDAVKISGYFIRKGGVVAVKDASEHTRVLRDPDDSILYRGPMVVLTSRISASASEILAGALKDYDRAVIVGDDHTFGKGTVQSVIPLRPGLGAMRVTTALFFRPGGFSTQNRGVETHVLVPSLFATEDFGEGAQPGSLPSQTIGPFRSNGANPAQAPRRYKSVTPSLVAELARRSRARVDESEIFQRIRKDLAERAEDDGVVELGELMKKRNGAKASDVARTETSGEEPEPTPQQQEALRILADLVQLES